MNQPQGQPGDIESGAPFQVTLPPRPYPGLRAFDQTEWPIFFGRERMVDAVVATLVQRQCVVVHGDSGAGKSSLIRAGVLPRLCQEQARSGVRWRTCVALPRGGPLGNLARELAALDGRADDTEHVLELRRLLNQGQRAPEALAAKLLSADGDHLCILIDQFEELFQHARQGGAGEARLLTDFIVRMAEAPPRGLYLAITMRSEFLGACAGFAGLAEAVNAHQYLLPPMNTPDLLRAIREPALLYGGSVDSALAERLALDAAGSDGLPLVQHALMRLHAQKRTDGDWQLAAADYPADGLTGLLSRHADEVADAARGVAGADAGVVERLFRALTAVSAEGQIVRRPQPLAQLALACGTPVDALARIVDVFRADGVSFLTARSRTAALRGEEWIDIGHEALVRCWSALSDPQRGWLIKEVRDGLVWRALLVQADSFEADDDNVLSEATTDERQRWLQSRSAAWAERHGGGWERVQALMAASVEARDEAVAERRHARRLRQGALGLAAVAMLAVAGIAVYLRVSAQQDAVEQAAQKRVEDEWQVQREKAQQNEKVIAQLETSIKALREARLSGSDARLRAQVDIETGLVKQATTNLKQIDLAPRIYLHIASESQRKDAVQLGALIAARKLDGAPLIVPGVQLVSQSNTGVLRCFNVDECRGEAQKLVVLINGLLASPQVKVQDLSKQYPDAKVRQRHYELWFGNGDLQLRQGIS